MSYKVQILLDKLAVMVNERPGVYTIQELSYLFDLSFYSVTNFVHKKKLPVLTKVDHQEEILQVIINNTNMTASELAELTGTRPQYISWLAFKGGIVLRKKEVAKKGKQGRFYVWDPKTNPIQ